MSFMVSVIMGIVVNFGFANSQSDLLVYTAKHVVASWEFTQGPLVGGESTMALRFLDSSTRQPIFIQDKVKVQLWMPSMGHGSAPTIVESKQNESDVSSYGLFKVRNMHFVMGGDWEIRVQLVDASGLSETKSFILYL